MAEQVKDIKKPIPSQQVEAPRVHNATAVSNSAQGLEEYLLNNGWEPEGENQLGQTMWRDPQGSALKNLAPMEVSLPNKEGPPSIIKQSVGPPLAWSLATPEAVNVQRKRTDGPTPIDRLIIAERRINELIKTLEVVPSQLMPLMSRPTPERAENLITEVRQLKAKIGEVINGVNVALNR